MKRTLLTITAAIALTTTASAADFFPVGADVIINDPTNSVAFCTDTQKSMDVLMQDIRDGDADAMKELLFEGHLVPVENWTHARVLEFDWTRNIYKVRVKGSNHPVWAIKEIVNQAS